MLATIEIVDLLDSSEHIGQMILQSDVYDDYQLAKEELEADEQAQHLIRQFQETKDHYEDVQRFGRYHPDYNNIMKNIRSVKREMDMNEKVAAFKKKERELQKLLDEVSQHVAFSVSQNIKVPRDGMALTDSGCGCGTGGGCGCS